MPRLGGYLMKNLNTLLLKTLFIISFVQNAAQGTNFPDIENVTEFIMRYAKKSRTLFLAGDYWKDDLEKNSYRTENTVFNKGLHEKVNNTYQSQITVNGHAFENELSPTQHLRFKKEMKIKDSHSQCTVISRITLAGASKITFKCDTTIPYARNMFR